MKLFLEVLPTEIFFETFDYLTAFDILYALKNLNKRINNIIGLYPLQLDFQQISRSKFDFICQHIQPKQVISIYLSDELMPDQVKLFNKYFPNFHHRFIYLKKIKFINTSTILSNFPINVSSLSIKTYLKTNNTDYFITKILNQQAQYLTYLKVDGSYVFRSMNTSFPLLQHLIIDYCTVTEFHRILHLFKSSLIYLKIFLDEEENFTILNFQHLSNTLIYLTINFSQEILISFELIKKFLQQLIKLKYLTIQATGTLDLMNGQLWEEYLIERKIKKFNFKFTLSNNLICHQDKNSLLQSFRSSFWLEKQHWYVACEKGELKSSRPTIYSIPYFQSSLIFYSSNNNNNLPITTNNKEIISKHVNNLILTFHKIITLPNLLFTHVYSLTLLTLNLPSIEILQSIVNIKQIREIDVSLIKNFSIDEFYILIDHMINLKHIKMQYNPLFIPPLHIDSYILIPKDEEIFVINKNNIKKFSYLFFHIKNLEITVQSKDIIIELINQLHYLERIKIFCYQDYLLNINYNWFQQNIPRFNTINFTYRITSSLFLSIGNRKSVNDETPVTNIKHKTVKCSWRKSCSGCELQ
ncbi:unnamed protein product [Rotaria sordida]|uniref:F-box domain-containing protein n=1 Tax=Rotaria sordida TaxID=392033 RepID=A0A819SHX4_9BILA|nr:unnamed protein product [Rotaria sordida]